MSLVVSIADLDVLVNAEASIEAALLMRLGEFAARAADVTSSHGRASVAVAPEAIMELIASDTIQPNPTVCREDLELTVVSKQMHVRPGPRGTWVGAIERALRFAYATWLPDGFLLHASAALGVDGVVAFAGGSGAGKSTVASQFAPDSHFTDDTLALCRRDDRWWGFSTPFVNNTSRLPHARSSPLWRVYFLRQSQSNEVLSLTSVEKAVAVLGNVVAGLPGSVSASTLDLAASLTQRVEMAALLRTRDGSIAPWMTIPPAMAHARNASLGG